MTTTLTSTTAAGVSRKLSNIGFDRYNRETGLGVSVHNDLGSIQVANHGYLPGTAAEELKAAGYKIDGLIRSECLVTGRHMELFNVVGRAEA